MNIVVSCKNNAVYRYIELKLSSDTHHGRLIPDFIVGRLLRVQDFTAFLRE